jgi:dipeptidyl aminopeptidase/acylaminoacyl peptidase
MGLGVRSEIFVDASRGTDAREDLPAKPTRTLPTQVYYPADRDPTLDPAEGAPPAKSGRPFPLVVFAHGDTVSPPAAYATLRQTWAAAGYVVAAPTFPLSSTTLPGGGADFVNQPADVSFVIGQLLALSAAPDGPYAGLIDPERIAVAGHSLGAMTALALTANSCCTDARIKAAVILAGAEQRFPKGSYFTGPSHVPTMVVHGDADTGVPIAEGQRVFADAAPPKVMLTVLMGDHSEPYFGDRRSSQARLVAATTLDFLDRYVKGRPDGLDRLRKAVADSLDGRLDVVETKS